MQYFFCFWKFSFFLLGCLYYIWAAPINTIKEKSIFRPTGRFLAPNRQETNIVKDGLSWERRLCFNLPQTPTSGELGVGMIADEGRTPNKTRTAPGKKEIL